MSNGHFCSWVYFIYRRLMLWVFLVLFDIKSFHSVIVLNILWLMWICWILVSWPPFVDVCELVRCWRSEFYDVFVSGNRNMTNSSFDPFDPGTFSLSAHSVYWCVQDGSIESNVPSTDLFPIHELNELEFFPCDFVVSTSGISNSCYQVFHASLTILVFFLENSRTSKNILENHAFF